MGLGIDCLGLSLKELLALYFDLLTHLVDLVLETSDVILFLSQDFVDHHSAISRANTALAGQ